MLSIWRGGIEMLKEILEILKRGNTAEVKKAKDGIMILEVKKKIQYRGAGEEENENLTSDVR
jgi:hypothetical protein